MAEEIKRHDIVFSLDLNKHPKDATNLSLINAENFKVSEDGASLISDKNLLENEIIRNKLESYYVDNKYEIVFCIPSNDEIVLFIASNYNEDKWYDLDIFRYSEKLNICSESIIPSEYEKMKYYGGKFSGTFTYNVKNELIIAFCEYDSVLPTEFECGEPMKIINLGYWKKNIDNEYKLINDNNLNPKTFPICPEVNIPTINSDKIISGYNKKGWYHLYIRYKIDNNNYTQWFNFASSYYLDDIKHDEIFNYSVDYVKTTEDNYQSIKQNFIVKDIKSDDYEFCSKAISLNLNNLDDKYIAYQIGYTCSTKTYTISKISEDVNIEINNIIIDYKLYNDYDINNFIKVYNNYYNVKNIINYNNRLYISNYKKYNNLPIINDVKYTITKFNINTNNYLILFDVNNNPINTKYKTDDNIPLSFFYNDLIASTGTYYTEYEQIKTSGNDNDIINTIYEYSKKGIITYIKYKPAYSINTYFEFTNPPIDEFIDNFFETINTYVGNYIIDIKYIRCTIKELSNITTKYNNNNISYSLDSYSFYKRNKRGGINSNNKQNVKSEFVAKITDDSIFNYIKNPIWSMIPNCPYNFFIHNINKFGEISEGIKLFNYNKYINEFDNKDCIKIEIDLNYTGISGNCSVHIYLFDKLFIDYKNINANELSDTDLTTIINSDIIYFPDDLTLYINDVEGNQATEDTVKQYVYRHIYQKCYKYINSDAWVCELIYLLQENNIYITRNKEVCLITDDSYNNIYNLTLNELSIKTDNKYFITYEKLDKYESFIGVYDKNNELNDKSNNLYTFNFNDISNKIIGIEYFYGKLYRIFKEQKLEDYSYNLSVGESVLDDPLIYIIENNEIKFVGEYYNKILNNNLNILKLNYELEDKACTSENGNGECTNYKDIYHQFIVINNNNINLYNKLNNKILIRCSQFTNNNEINIEFRSHIGVNSILSFDEKGVIIDANNHLKFEDNSDYYGYDNSNIKIPIKNYLYLSYSLNFPESKQLNNKPKTYYTIQSNPNTNNNPEFKTNLVFLPIDILDLYKNNSLKYDDSVLNTYFNYNENNINQTNFIKTICRSTYIKDESLENGWRIFESEEYQNIQENKGEITKIEGIGDLLLVHTKDSLFQFDKSNLLVTENKTVQLGQQDIFNVNYKEIFTTPYGYGGLQDKEAAIVGEFGYIWYNNDFNKIYQYNAGSLNVISRNIEFLLNRFKPIKCRFVDDKQNKRLLIQFQLNNDKVLNLTYNYDIKSFISFYINKDSDENVFNEVYNTKTKFYILENNKIFSGFGKSNAKKLSFIINEQYSKIKRLNYIKYKLYKKEVDNDFDANSPVEGILPINYITTHRPYSGYKLRVYNDLCDTGELNIETDLKAKDNTNIDKPYYDLGNFTFNYLRNVNDNNQIFGNFFIVEFIFSDEDEDKDTNNDNIIEFESLEYGINYEEN